MRWNPTCHLLHTHIPREGCARTAQEDSRVWARERVLAGNWPCQHLDRGLPASRAVRKWNSVVKPPSVVFSWGSLSRQMLAVPGQSLTASLCVWILPRPVPAWACQHAGFPASPVFLTYFSRRMFKTAFSTGHFPVTDTEESIMQMSWLNQAFTWCCSWFFFPTGIDLVCSIFKSI